MLEKLHHNIAHRKSQHLWRERRAYTKVSSTHVKCGGRTLLSFASNDYLGLSFHPHILATYHQALNRYGAGSNASHLVSGYSDAHAALEEALATFLGTECAMLFSSGYTANVGTLSTLLKPDDLALVDRDSHASLLDGVLLSRARLSRYPHLQLDRVEKSLSNPHYTHKMIITDGTFSMRGEAAPLMALQQLAHPHQAWLFIDDTHGIGSLGATGRGTIEQQHFTPDAQTIISCSLAKAFGTQGGFVAGNKILIENLVQFARSAVYTCALPAAVAAASLASLHVIQTEPERRARLQIRIQQWQEGAAQIQLPVLSSSTPIQAVMVGDAAKTQQLGEQLMAKGVLVGAIRPPSVPPEKARLRITLTAEHTPAQIEQLLSLLREIWPDA